MKDSASGPRFVTVGRSSARDAPAAVREAISAIDTAATCFVLAFLPPHLDVGDTIASLNDLGQGVPVFGCTTAGQISCDGYETEALVLLAFPKENFRCSSILFEPLRPFSATTIAMTAQQHSKKFRHTAGWNRLGLIFADGVSNQEDILISTLEAVLGDFPIFGGSAADGLRFEQTFVLQKGRAHDNAAVLLMIETNLQFHGLGFDHFLPMGQPLVITGADPDERLVHEINGAPAALEYARLVGCQVEDLCPQVFAENPLLLEHNQRHYVRAISDATDGHSLTFLAAIDEGLIMTLGVGQEILETLEAGLDLRDKSEHAPDFILGFDCVLRKLEIEHKQLGQAVSHILSDRRVFGFNTYGEQQSGLHMNQTFVGVAFFEPKTRALRL